MVMEYALSSVSQMVLGSTETGADHVTPASSDHSAETCSPALPSGLTLPVMVHIQRPEDGRMAQYLEE